MAIAATFCITSRSCLQRRGRVTGITQDSAEGRAISGRLEGLSGPSRKVAGPSQAVPTTPGPRSRSGSAIKWPIKTRMQIPQLGNLRRQPVHERICKGPSLAGKKPYPLPASKRAGTERGGGESPIVICTGRLQRRQIVAIMVLLLVDDDGGARLLVGLSVHHKCAGLIGLSSPLQPPPLASGHHHHEATSPQPALKSHLEWLVRRPR